jgi:hypothetical protein
MLMDKLFDWLTELEGHRSMSDNKASNTLKTFIAEYINTGFIVLLVNYKLFQESGGAGSNSLFRGKFEDFSALWY